MATVRADLLLWATALIYLVSMALLLADARHTLSDVGVTLAVLGSMGLVWLGFPKADGIVTLGVLVVVARLTCTLCGGEDEAWGPELWKDTGVRFGERLGGSALVNQLYRKAVHHGLRHAPPLDHDAMMGLVMAEPVFPARPVRPIRWT